LRRMFFSGTDVGGAMSLNTFLPCASIHCHCAQVDAEAKQAITTKATRKQVGSTGEVFMDVVIA
jgi:hypothetical protein